MKDKIDLIFSDLKNEVITEKQAHQQVLDLFAVMPSLPSDDIVREAANNYAFNRYYEQKNPYDTTVTDFEEGIRWIRRYINQETPPAAKPQLAAVGQRCYMDKKIANSGMVEIVKVYDSNHCRVRCTRTKIEWDTMFYLLRNCR